MWWPPSGRKQGGLPSRGGAQATLEDTGDTPASSGRRDSSATPGSGSSRGSRELSGGREGLGGPGARLGSEVQGPLGGREAPSGRWWEPWVQRKQLGQGQGQGHGGGLGAGGGGRDPTHGEGAEREELLQVHSAGGAGPLGSWCTRTSHSGPWHTTLAPAAGRGRWEAWGGRFWGRQLGFEMWGLGSPSGVSWW